MPIALVVREQKKLVVEEIPVSQGIFCRINGNDLFDINLAT